MKSDIQIAQESIMLPIKEVAASIGIAEDDLELYGKYKAKISDELIEKTKGNPDGKLILVTAINPTPAGEGKTTVSVGLGQALGKIGKKGDHRPSGAIPWSLLRNQGRSRRRRIFTGCSHGGSESSFYRGFSCHYFRQ